MCFFIKNLERRISISCPHCGFLFDGVALCRNNLRVETLLGAEPSGSERVVTIALMGLLRN